MKIINKVMVFVMGVVVIGVVATTVSVTTQAKNVERSVTFEVLENQVLTIDAYSKINDYAILDVENDVTNLINATVNSVEVFTTPFLYYDDAGFTLIDEVDDLPMIVLTSSGYDEMGGIVIGDIITITFDVEVSTPVFVKTLILLIPLVLSASVIGYLVIKDGKE